MHNGVLLGFKGSGRVPEEFHKGSSSMGVLGFQTLGLGVSINSEGFDQAFAGGSTEFRRFRECSRNVSKSFRGSQEHKKA